MMNYLLYIDPGSGSYFIQVIIAALLGAAFWIKMSWQRIKSFFNRNRKTDDKEEDNTAD